MATHSSVLAWRIPGAAEPGGLPSMGSHRAGHDWSDLAAAVTFLWTREMQLRERPQLTHWPVWLYQAWEDQLSCQGGWDEGELTTPGKAEICIALGCSKSPRDKHSLLDGDLPAAAAAKSLQSCPTLCDPRDGSPPGSPVPGILQARTLEWVAISFSNAWKWKVKVKSLSRVRLLATPWTAAHQAPLSMGFSRQEYWSGVLLPSPGDLPKHAQFSTWMSQGKSGNKCFSVQEWINKWGMKC